MSNSITVRLSVQHHPKAQDGEVLLLVPLSCGEGVALPPIAVKEQQKILKRIGELLTGLADANTNQDWWYLPVSEMQPIMSVTLQALELEAHLRELIKSEKSGRFLLSVPDANVSRYLLNSNFGCVVTATLADQMKWALDRFKTMYRRPVNALFWAVEHYRNLANSQTVSGFPSSVKTLFISRFESDLEAPDQNTNQTPWWDRYLGDLVEEGRRFGEVAVLGRCGGDPARLSKMTSGYEHFALRTVYQMLNTADITKSVLRALHLKLRSPDLTPLSRMIVAESRNHVRAVADCVLVENAVTKALNHAQPERVVCMQENSVWEHAVVRACRRASSRPRLLGYFHCPVIPSAIRYHRWATVKGRPEFDCVVPLGDAMAAALSQLGSWEEVLVPGYGFRNPDIEKCLAFEPHSTTTPFRVVVLLGGMFDNAVFLKWVDEARTTLGEHRLLIKGHPIYGSEQALQGAGISVSENLGIEDISHLSISETLKNADCVLYKGTTAGLSALAAGVPVIHIDHGGLQSDDTLFNSNGLATSVRTFEEFQASVMKVMNWSDKDRLQWATRAKAYARRYYELSAERKYEVVKFIFEKNTGDKP